MPPFEIHVFSPSSTQPSPSRAALMSMAATSDPELGSVRAKAAMAVRRACARASAAARRAEQAESARRQGPAWRTRSRPARHGGRASRATAQSVRTSSAPGCPGDRRRLEPALPAEHGRRGPARGVGSVMVDRQDGRRPAIEPRRPIAMTRSRRTASEKACGIGSSVSLENRRGLGDEGLVGAREVTGLHADRLRLRLGLDGLVDAHRPLLVEQRLGHHMREGRAARRCAGRGPSPRTPAPSGRRPGG